MQWLEPPLACHWGGLQQSQCALFVADPRSSMAVADSDGDVGQAVVGSVLSYVRGTIDAEWFSQAFQSLSVLSMAVCALTSPSQPFAGIPFALSSQLSESCRGSLRH